MKQDDQDRDTWIENLQWFQNNVGTSVTPREQLEEDWKNFKTKARKQRELESIKTHVAITKAAINAGKNRRS